MKYCVDFNKDFRYLNEIDELNIHFRKNDTSLLDFLLLYKDKRVNIIIDNEEDFIKSECIKIFDAIIEKHPEVNFVFRINHTFKDLIKILKENPIKHKFFFDASAIRDWDTLLMYIELEPSDIYITESLGFELDVVAKVLHEKGIRIRVFPNVAQSSWSKMPIIKQFFIRPEDVSIYAKNKITTGMLLLSMILKINLKISL